eukprot:GEMP01014649.1.p1 GENE.GEMP01014649.1~~GEMP01014649.1.p1  ORF type:complete len:348 (+),score=59.19 GEMP01014649.1:39-1046(+)
MADGAPKKCRVVLEDFVLVKVLGTGSYGKVLLVHHKDDESRVFAMKMVRKKRVLEKNEVEHAKAERNVLQMVDHPFIVNLLYAFQTPKKLYYVLEYCAGGELFFHLNKDKGFTEGKTRFYAAEMVLAIQYLHSLDIIYRDLKPENVLLDRDGHIKLTDFGVSKEGIADDVFTNSLCGTPEYMAPEVLTQGGHGKAVDWYSLGAIIYEMLTRRPPYYTDKKDQLKDRILHAELLFPDSMGSAAKGLCQDLLTRDPDRRLGTHNDEDIKKHPFWGAMDWVAVLERRLTPPFKPVVSGNTDVRYFHEDFVNQVVYNSEQNNSGAGANPLRIEDFSYES